MKSEQLNASVDDFLLARGLRVEDYFIEVTPFSEVLCYRNAESREFDLPIRDPELAAAIMHRLRSSGVRIVELR